MGRWVQHEHDNTMLDIIFWNFGILYKNLDSLQIKQYLISTINNFVYELPHGLPNNVGRSEEIKNYQKNAKIGWRQCLGTSLPFRNKNFVTAVKNKVEAVIKVFCSCPVLLDSLTLCQIFLSKIVETKKIYNKKYHQKLNHFQETDCNVS